MIYPAAILKRPKVSGFVNHVGVLLSNGTVAHNSPERGEHISSLKDFAKGQRVTIDEPINATFPVQTQIVLKQVNTAPRQYDAISNNCEHFVNRCLGREEESKQLQFFVCTALAVFAICYFFSKRSS